MEKKAEEEEECGEEKVRELGGYLRDGWLETTEWRWWVGWNGRGDMNRQSTPNFGSSCCLYNSQGK